MKLGTGNQTRASNFALKSRQRYSYRCHCPLPAGLLSPPEQQKPRQQTHQWRFIFWSTWYLRCTADCTLDALTQSGRSKKSSIPRGSQTLLWGVGGWSPIAWCLEEGKEQFMWGLTGQICYQEEPPQSLNVKARQLKEIQKPTCSYNGNNFSTFLLFWFYSTRSLRQTGKVWRGFPLAVDGSWWYAVWWQGSHVLSVNSRDQQAVCGLQRVLLSVSVEPDENLAS